MSTMARSSSACSSGVLGGSTTITLGRGGDRKRPFVWRALPSGRSDRAHRRRRPASSYRPPKPGILLTCIPAEDAAIGLRGGASHVAEQALDERAELDRYDLPCGCAHRGWLRVPSLRLIWAIEAAPATPSRRLRIEHVPALASDEACRGVRGGSMT
jgi:hypothetical protein